MGFACPVCSTPQRDGEHLAHHLAFTAIIHGADHEAWLDEHVPEWGSFGPTELAKAATPYAEEAVYRDVFEDTASRGRPRLEHQSVKTPVSHHGGSAMTENKYGTLTSAGDAEPNVDAVIRKAKELTQQMYDKSGSERNDALMDDTASATED